MARWLDSDLRVTYNAAVDASQQHLQPFSSWPVREKISAVSKSNESNRGCSAREIGERYGITSQRISQIQSLERLTGTDGKKIKDAIDDRTLGLDRVVKAIQGSAFDEISKIQKTLLGDVAVDRKIERGFNPSPTKTDLRKTNCGRRKAAAKTKSA